MQQNLFGASFIILPANVSPYIETIFDSYPITYRIVHQLFYYCNRKGWAYYEKKEFTILIVDDNTATVRILSYILKREGYKV